jgi:plasmid stabilization system protein ParE
LRQADKYVRELVIAIHSLSGERRLWKPLADEELEGIFYFRHQRHYVFFRELQAGEIGVISVLHESMDLPNRLKEDSGRS